MLLCIANRGKSMTSMYNPYSGSFKCELNYCVRYVRVILLNIEHEQIFRKDYYTIINLK